MGFKRLGITWFLLCSNATLLVDGIQPSARVHPSRLLMDMIQTVREGPNINSRFEHGARRPAIPLLGAHDALSARIAIQQHQLMSMSASLPARQQRSNDMAIFVSGFGVSASRLGQPDSGILTRAEMEDSARNIIQHCSESSLIFSEDKINMKTSPIPVIVDGDTGYGGPSNLRQTIRRAAALGAAAVSIEDQIFPKRCTYVAGTAINVLDRQESIKRLKAAMEAKREALEKDGNEILIIGRTDCRMARGFQEAKARCLSFEQLSADIVYAENLQTSEEYLDLRSSIRSPMILAQVQSGAKGQKIWTLDEVGLDLGFEVALWGISSLQAAVAAMMDATTDFYQIGGPISRVRIASLADVKTAVGFDDLESFELNFPCV